MFAYKFYAIHILLYIHIKQEKDQYQQLNFIIITLKQTLTENKYLKQKIKSLNAELQKCTCRKSLSEKLLRTNNDATFYTGIPTLTCYNKIHDYVSCKIKRKWRGAKKSSTKIRNFSKSPKKFGPKSKLSSKDEFLLIMMKIRLGLLEKDLSNRFGISITLCSQIFSTWTRALALYLKPLVFVPSMISINEVKPNRYKIAPKLHSIGDGAEMFIETPKNHDLQRMTWSNYKHHNTLKILVCCTPSSLITFISDAYCGSISDKELTKSSGYLDLIEPYTEFMVDKGFLISDECAARHIYLRIPPGKRGQSQLSYKAVKDTNEIAKLRILSEQVIRRIKTFRLLAQEIPINVLSHIDL